MCTVRCTALLRSSLKRWHGQSLRIGFCDFICSRSLRFKVVRETKNKMTRVSVSAKSWALDKVLLRKFFSREKIWEAEWKKKLQNPSPRLSRTPPTARLMSNSSWAAEIVVVPKAKISQFLQRIRLLLIAPLSRALFLLQRLYLEQSIYAQCSADISSFLAFW